MTGPIVVINPNSNQQVTYGIDAALSCFRIPGGPEIKTETLEAGPFGIESQRDADSVILPLVSRMEKQPQAAAFVIACYSDPGLDACRAATDAPVFGIQESGMLAALARGDLVGVIALSPVSIARHRRYVRRMGLADRVAGERAADLSVHESATPESAARLSNAGHRLVEDGADVIVLGCAGMAAHRVWLEENLGVPVIDPTQAAVSMALSAVLTARD